MIVNRPFSAFATLMTLLALAMFAVSSTSRSTTVKPVASVQVSGFRVQRPAFEVSDQKSALGGRKLEVGKKQVVMKSPEKSFVAVTTRAELEPLSTRSRDLRAAMRTTQVVAADNSLARTHNTSAMDYLSHYDATYDLVVYGIRDSASVMPPIEMEFQAAPANLAGELDAIFHELASRQLQQALPQAGAMKMQRKGVQWKALAVAVGSWLKYHVGRTMDPEFAAGVEWADYAELADRAIAENVATIETTGTSDARMSVRSSDWLRHSAALSLHQLSLMLAAAAAEIDSDSRPTLSTVAH